jgi:hypothetical protein
MLGVNTRKTAMLLSPKTQQDKNNFLAKKGLSRLSSLNLGQRLFIIIGLLFAIVILINGIMAIIFGIGTNTGTFNGPLDWLRNFFQVSFTTVSNAYAGTSGVTCPPPPQDGKQYIPLGFATLLAFLVIGAFGVWAWSADASKVEKAADFLQVLIGFVTGAVTSLLGLK